MRNAVQRNWLSDPVDARISRHIRSGKEGESHEYGKPIGIRSSGLRHFKGGVFPPWD